MAPQLSSLRTSFRALCITRIEIKERVIYTSGTRQGFIELEGQNQPKIELNDASIRIYSMKSYGCPNFVRIFRDKTQSGENLIVFGGQKRWIFLAVLGSPGKVANNRTLEVVGSTPIGSTNFSTSWGVT
jgi:hypothetical protein